MGYPDQQLDDALERIEELEKALQTLVSAKERKAFAGKDETYRELRDRGWALAQKALRRDL